MVTECMQFFALCCAFACFTHKGRHEITELRSGQGTVSLVDSNSDLACGKIVVRIS